MTCLIKGCNFVLKNIPHEAFVYAKHGDSEFRFQNTHPDIFPYLLINIGSGVSIVKVLHWIQIPLLHNTHKTIQILRLSKGSTHVLFLKVEAEDKFERIGGSSIGGGTFWGLGALLTKTKVVHFVKYYQEFLHFCFFSLFHLLLLSIPILCHRGLMSFCSQHPKDNTQMWICLLKTSMEVLTGPWD